MSEFKPYSMADFRERQKWRKEQQSWRDQSNIEIGSFDSENGLSYFDFKFSRPSDLSTKKARFLMSDRSSNIEVILRGKDLNTDKHFVLQNNGIISVNDQGGWHILIDNNWGDIISNVVNQVENLADELIPRFEGIFDNEINKLYILKSRLEVFKEADNWLNGDDATPSILEGDKIPA